MEFRLPMNGYAWYFCTNCPEWPPEKYEVVRIDDPLFAEELEICDQCKALHDSGHCIPCE